MFISSPTKLPYLLVKKFVSADGRKNFPQFRWQGNLRSKASRTVQKVRARLPI